MKINILILLFTSIITQCNQGKEPLNILFVVGNFPILTETFIRNQVTRFIDRGHNIWIHSFHRGEAFDLHPDLTNYNLQDRISYGAVCPNDLDTFDILYCQFGMQANYMLKQKKISGSNAKLVSCFRGYDISLHLRQNPNMYHDLLQDGDLFLPVCDYFAARLKQLGADLSKIIVHHSAIECSQFERTIRPFAKNPKRPIHIVSVSRFVEKKGIEYAIKAIALLVEKYPNIYYTMVGDGVLKEDLYALRKKLGLRDHITMTGALPHQKVIQLLKNADILIMPSVTAHNGDQEGIPNVLKEAMACGIPVISTYHSGIPELVDNYDSGLLSLERDEYGLARHIEYLINNPHEWESMGKKGREKVEKEYDIDLMIDNLEQHFYNLLQK